MDTGEDFLSKFLDGNWKTILAEKTFETLENWFKEVKNHKKVVVRFVAYDTDRQARFAIHLVCTPKIKKGSVVVLERYVPSPDTFDTSPNLLVALPPSLYELPLFCVPSDKESEEDFDD